MARWKAWLCRFGIPGTTIPLSRSAPAAPAPGSTAIRSPRPSISSRTPAANPSGSKAVSAHSAVIGAGSSQPEKRRPGTLPTGARYSRQTPQVNRLDEGAGARLPSRLSREPAESYHAELGQPMDQRPSRHHDRGAAAPTARFLEGALAVLDGRIAWVGAEADLPHRDSRALIDGRGGWLTPGLIDCHTHLVFAGDRSGEFEQRLQGVSYEAIARAGGGIASTVAATRAASAEALEESAGHRLDALRAGGVTTVEIKSGYGLDLETEVRMLEVARRLGRGPGIEVRTSFLGAHAAAARVRGRPGGLSGPGLRADVAGGRGRRPGRCGRRLLRRHRLQPGRGRARLRGCEAPRPAGQAARRSALGSGRRRARGAVRRALGRSSGIYQRGGRAGDGRRRHRGGPAAGRLLYLARGQAAAGRGSCAGTAYRSRSRPTAIPAPRRSFRCSRCSTWRAPCSA